MVCTQLTLEREILDHGMLVDKGNMPTSPIIFNDACVQMECVETKFAIGIFC